MENLWKAVPKDSRGNSVPELPKLINKCRANPFLVEEHPSRDLWTLMGLALLVFCNELKTWLPAPGIWAMKLSKFNWFMLFTVQLELMLATSDVMVCIV